jgi:hypothetical protein
MEMLSGKVASVSFEAPNPFANSALNETNKVLDIGILVDLVVLGGGTVDFLLDELVEFLYPLVVSPNPNDGIVKMGWDKERRGWESILTVGSRISRR